MTIFIVHLKIAETPAAIFAMASIFLWYIQYVDQECFYIA